MVNIYLWVNACLYAVFAFWCTFKLADTSKSLGFLSLNSSGHSEYVTIYGGLQVGLAIFFALCAMDSTWHRIGLIFSLCLYGGIVLFRLGSLAVFWPVEKMTIGVATLEVSLLLWAVGLWWTMRH